jgi:hypothetical protein
MREMRKRVSAAIWVAMLAVPVVVQAMIIFGERALPAMIGDSVTVVVGTVTSIASDMPGYRVVKVRVMDTWKGTHSSEVDYTVLNSRLACDVSDGVVGERVVLFLGKGWPEGHLAILESGRGRMPIQGSDADPIVILTLPQPEGLTTIPTQVDNGGMGSGCRLATLKAYVQSVLENPSTP